MAHYPQPNIKERSIFGLLSSIWIVPFVALVIALWLAWQHYSALGPKIVIIFPKNEGLQAGQSVIKYKDVPIGKVVKIEIGNDGEGVHIYAQMNKEAEPFLNEETKFWIVKPEVGVTGVSGLETLLSGTYINMHAKKLGFSKKRFYGLTHAYRNIGEGEYFHLQAPQAYNVVKGTPVYFKNIKVGQVEYVTVSLDGKSVDFVIFVDQLYVPYIHTDSKFWVMSALDVDVSGGKLDINVAPIGHLVHSGIAFSSRGEDLNDTVADDFVFFLYKNHTLANEKKIGKGGKHTTRYVTYVSDSVAKLSLGAPVRFQGYEVGRVKEIHVDYNRTNRQMEAKIELDIDVSSFADEQYNGNANFQHAIRDGLRARITPTDPITGILYIDLVFDHNKTLPRWVDVSDTIPSISRKSFSIIEGLEAFVQKLNRLPLQRLIDELEQTVATTKGVIKDSKKPLVDSLKLLQKTLKNIQNITSKQTFKQLPDEVISSLHMLNDTLHATKKLLKSYHANSPMGARISDTLKGIEAAAHEMEKFLKMLNRKPNSLIFGDK